jgi:hypothetical protein
MRPSLLSWSVPEKKGLSRRTPMSLGICKRWPFINLFPPILRESLFSPAPL